MFRNELNKSRVGSRHSLNSIHTTKSTWEMYELPTPSLSTINVLQG